MIRRLLKRCRSQSGETIAETLVALLISALALTMLAGSITTATRVTKRGENAVMAYYTATNKVLKGDDSEIGNIYVYKAGTDDNAPPQAHSDQLIGNAGGIVARYKVYSGIGTVPVGAYTYNPTSGG